MTYSSLARPAFLLAAAAAIGACSSGTSTTSAAPAPSASAPAASSAAARPAGGLPSGVTAAMVAEGDSLFHARSCRNCHGPDAKGRQNGPDLTSGTFMHVNGSYADFVRIITSGVPADSIKDKSHTLAMNPRGGGRPPLLTDDQIKSVAAYVYSLNHK
jgi:mono/diheme cytochrome c family protein